MATGFKLGPTHFNIALQVLLAVKDSNAAPSSANTSASKPSRGKAAAPKARAKAVSKAKSRSKAKANGTKKAVAPAVGAAPVGAAPVGAAPVGAVRLETPAITTAGETETPQVAPATPIVEAPEVPVAQAVVADVKNEAPAVQAARSATPQADPAAPEILFPEVLTPKVVPTKKASKTTATAATPTKADIAKAAVAKADIAKVVAPKNVASKTAVASGVATKAAPVKTGVAAGTSAKTANVPAAARQRSLPKFRPLYVFAALTALVLTTAGGVAVGSYNHWSNSLVIAPKVRIAGEPIGGMTREQAIAHLNTRFAKLALTLQAGDKNTVLGLKDIGGQPSIEPTVDKAFAIGRSGNLVDNFTRVFSAEVKPHNFSLPIEWNRGALTSRLQIVNNQYEEPAVDARLVTVSGAAPRVTGEQNGRALDVSATADAIQKSYYLGLDKVAAVTTEVEPKVTAADLAGRDVRLGFYRTEYNGGIAGRTTNIHVACRAIDGTVLMPGEVLSFNGLTGERTYKKGYRMAHIFMREAGQTESSIVDGLAGGVCQVSSTLYNAVRKTNLAAVGKPLGIVERSSHSLPVTYVPSGRDATVAWPSKDFKFRNDQNYPIYVRTEVGNGRLTISIWGRVPQNQVVPVSLED